MQFDTYKESDGLSITYFGDIVPHWYAYPPKSSYDDVEHFSHCDLGLDASSGINVYVHIPFCNMKCSFCSLFTTAGGSANAIDEYVNYLVREIRQFFQAWPGSNPRICSLYFGGGTPSILSRSQLDKIMAELVIWGIDDRTEKSVEFSPEATTPNIATQWYSYGFRRASIGVQSFSDKRLRQLRRHHTALQAKKALMDLADAGFSLINADLIFGHDDQSLASWEEDLRCLLATAATCCTFHPLAIQSKTAFDRRIVQVAESGPQRSKKHFIAIDFFASEHWALTSSISASRHGHLNPIEQSESEGVPTIGFGAGSRTYANELHLSTLPASRRLSFGSVMRHYREAVDENLKPALSMLKVSNEENIRRRIILKLHHGFVSRRDLDACLECRETHGVPELFEQLIAARLLNRVSDGYQLTTEGAVEYGQVGALLAGRAVQARLLDKIQRAND